MAISLTEIQTLQEALKTLQSPFSEHSIGNLYLFQTAHSYSCIEIEATPWIQGISYEKKPFLLPLTPIFHLEAIQEYIFHQADLITTAIPYLYPIQEIEFKKYFEPFGWKATLDTGDADYIYAAQSFKTFKGRALDGRRNQLHAFQRAHLGVYSEPLSENNLQHAHDILSNWALHHTQAEPSDTEACRKALEEFEHISLQGRLLYADQVPVGFILGEPLTHETYVFHFAKAARLEKGLYQYLYYEMANSLPAQFTKINMEQDLGIKGLRQAKLLYNPLEILSKLRVTPPGS